MLKNILFLMIICGAATGQDSKPEGKPKLTFTNITHDFGTIERGEKVSVNFEFKNTGDAELELSDVKASCGCTTATPDKLNYDPGETGTIPVTFDSTRFDGPITKTINVSSNDADMPHMQLRITGNVRTEITMEPNSLAISNIRRSENVAREFLIKSEVLKQLEITELKSSLEFMKLEQVRVNETSIKVNVTFAGSDLPKDRDIFQGQITFKTNGAKMKDGILSVFIRILKPVQARPGSVYFFSTTQGEGRESEVMVSGEGIGDFTLGKINSSESYLSAELLEGNRIKIILAKDAPMGKFEGKITIETNVEEQPVLVIPVRGSVI